MIFIYYREGNGQNCPKSLLLNALKNVEIVFFLEIGSEYSLLPIKIEHFPFYRKLQSRCYDRAMGSNRITLTCQWTLLKFLFESEALETKS